LKYYLPCKISLSLLITKYTQAHPPAAAADDASLCDARCLLHSHLASVQKNLGGFALCTNVALVLLETFVMTQGRGISEQKAKAL
jgi:hypothetical protein